MQSRPVPRPRYALAALAWLAIAAIPGQALWTGDGVHAFRVPDNSIRMDGRPDSVWRAISAAPNGKSTISFTDYGKMVLLQPVKSRNDDPSKYVPDPVNGSATLLAAYDSQALYFFLLVQTKTTVANPKGLGCADVDLWRTDAAEVYVDPSAWSQDPATYRSYFTADAGGLVYGTSPKSIQLAKPIHHEDSARYYYRNRATADRFQSPAAKNPAIIALSARHSVGNPGLRGVEMKIPFWTTASDFAAGKAMFLSWGFNLYADSLWANCTANPLAYRWAKHTFNYDGEDEKPPGWIAKDTTHYDPVRSWDGWGRLSLEFGQFDQRSCRQPVGGDFNSSWDLTVWRNACASAPVTTSRRRHGITLDAAGMPVPSGLRSRDARGRVLPPGSRSGGFPL